MQGLPECLERGGRVGGTARAQQSVQPRGVQFRHPAAQPARQRLRATRIGDPRQFLVEPAQAAASLGCFGTPGRPYTAVTNGEIELLGTDGTVLRVYGPNDINLSLDSVRVRRANAPRDAKPGSSGTGGSSDSTDGSPQDDPPDPTSDPDGTSGGLGATPVSFPEARGVARQARHWQITLNVNTGIDPDSPDDNLLHLLREIANRGGIFDRRTSGAASSRGGGPVVAGKEHVLMGRGSCRTRRVCRSAEVD